MLRSSGEQAHRRLSSTPMSYAFHARTKSTIRRWAILGALWTYAASDASAQAPDSLSKRDSVARADSIQRADSARMQRELGRIRNEPRNRTVVSEAERPPSRRRPSRPSLRFELGVALPSTLVEDANGTTIQTGFAPVLGVAGTWMISPKVQAAIGVRGSFASVTADGGSNDWDAGRSSQIALRAALEQGFDYGVGVFAGGSAVWLSGPDDVTPFRDNAGLHWGGDVGARWRASPSRRLSVFAAVEAFMLGGKTNADPIARPAWARRFVLGVRHGS